MMERTSDTFHKAGLTSLENPSFSNEKTDWMDVEREQEGAMGCFVLCTGFLTPLAINGRAPAVAALPVFGCTLKQRLSRDLGR